MNLKALWIAALSALCPTLSAHAATAVQLEVLDRKTGEVLPVHWHDGARYVAGEPGREYEIRLRNPGDGRMLAVTSVDGINVITGKTAATLGSGYVLDPGCLVDIDGWRKSMEQVAAFYFTALPDSYAARTGRPDNVGVIGVALFRERVRVAELERDERANSATPAPSAEASAAQKSTGASSGLLRQDDKLGTGHGRRLDSGAVYTDF